MVGGFMETDSDSTTERPAESNRRREGRESKIHVLREREKVGGKEREGDTYTAWALVFLWE